MFFSPELCVMLKNYAWNILEFSVLIFLNSLTSNEILASGQTCAFHEFFPFRLDCEKKK